MKGTEWKAIRGDITGITDVEPLSMRQYQAFWGERCGWRHSPKRRPRTSGECRTLHGCPTGEAKLTGAYRLSCKYVIHTPGPVWRGGGHGERELLASCYRSCLELAVENGVRRIAFPSISTGVYHFPVEEAARIAVGAAERFVREYPGRLDLVEWVLFDDRTWRIYTNELDKRMGKGEGN